MTSLASALYGLIMNTRSKRHRSSGTILRLQEVADHLGIRRQRLSEWARLGLLPCVVSLGTRSNDRVVGYCCAEADLPELASMVEQLKKGVVRR